MKLIDLQESMGAPDQDEEQVFANKMNEVEKAVKSVTGEHFSSEQDRNGSHWHFDDHHTDAVRAAVKHLPVRVTTGWVTLT